MANRIASPGETSFLASGKVEDLASDALLIIFKAFITDGYVRVFQSLSNLALVRKSWKQAADSLEIGRCLFHHMGWRFPKQNPDSWKMAFQLQSGNLFIHSKDLKPKVITLDYPPFPFPLHQQQLKWIEDSGFAYYRHGDLEFSVFLFDKPKITHKVLTDAGITAVSVFKEYVICGLKNGSIAAYHLETLELFISYPAHQEKDTIQNIFETEDAWISVSNRQIVKYNPLTHQSYCLLDEYNPYIKDSIYPSMQCTNQHLFFKFDPGEEIAITPIRYFMLSLRKPHGLEKIPPPQQINLRQITSWGDEIASLSYSSQSVYSACKYSHTLETFTICRFSFHPCAFYSGEPETVPTPIIIEHTKKRVGGEVWQFHFRGAIACLIWKDYDFPSSISLYHIQFIDLKNKGEVIFEHCDSDIDMYRATIANNKFIYLQSRLSKLVILDFPLTSPIRQQI